MSVFIIAELGINHNGDPEICKRLVAAAKECGADAAKLQLNNPREISADPWLIKVQEETRLSLAELADIKEYADSIDLEIFSSVGDISALADFRALGFPRVKISSSNLLNGMLHESAADLGVPVIVSTGDADIGSIRRVTTIYKARNCNLTLLHCIPRYPTPLEECVLGAIDYLRESCGVPVGFSDHTVGDEAVALAVAMGATIIEKHFTLDRQSNGPDHHFSANPAEFRAMVTRIRAVESICGQPETLFEESRDRSQSIVRRAIVFRTKQTKGHSLRLQDLLIARPKTQRNDSINPLDYSSIIGRVLARDIGPFEALSWEDVV